MSIKSRQRANSIFVYLIFGILIAVFIISFGPQSISTGQGCNSVQDVGRVSGQTLNINDWRFAWGLTDGQDRARNAMSGLVRRELLASLAKERGYRVNDETVDASISGGNLYFGGVLVSKSVAMVQSTTGSHFNYEALSNIAQNFGGLGNYRSQQKRELLAHVADAETRFGMVATDEARALFTAQNSYVNLEYVRFSQAEYGAALRLEDADIARFLATHETKVKEAYDAQKASYTGTPARKKLRLLRVEKGTDSAASKAKAESARAQVIAKQKTVAGLVGAESLGWRDAATPMLATDALNSAVAALNAGDVSDVLEDADAFYVVGVEGARQGDLTFDDVKGELAEVIARQVWGQEAARKAALEAAAALAAGKQLEALFKKKDEAVVGRSTWASDITLAQSETIAVTAADAPAPTAAAPQADPMRPVTETLPPLKSAVTPSLDSQLMVRRTAEGLTGFGDSKALARAAFNDLTPGQAAPSVYAAGDDYVVVRLIGRSTMEEAEFAKQAETMADVLAKNRGIEQASTLLRQRCLAAAEAREISVNTTLLQDAETGAALPPFSPCAGL